MSGYFCNQMKLLLGLVKQMYGNELAVTNRCADLGTLICRSAECLCYRNRQLMVDIVFSALKYSAIKHYVRCNSIFPVQLINDHKTSKYLYVWVNKTC